MSASEPEGRQETEAGLTESTEVGGGDSPCEVSSSPCGVVYQHPGPKLHDRPCTYRVSYLAVPIPPDMNLPHM